ncbi:hypothetical protein [Actinomadura sp. 21ATH]|uniref:hypothetical protein n=1 Tax=Actinomadura sp. 21ATH TaxID=1735444 RepID=UPI0035C23423
MFRALLVLGAAAALCVPFGFYPQSLVVVLFLALLAASLVYVVAQWRLHGAARVIVRARVAERDGIGR